jgi:SAM-dependent methyltransferase
LPLYGLHFPLCAALCMPFGLDAVTAYIASNFSNPFVAPFLVSAEIQIGSLLLDGRFVDFDPHRAREVGLGAFVTQAAVGALTLGAALAAVGALLTWVLMRNRRPPIPRVVDAKERTIDRYYDAKRGDRVYLRTKLAFDPIFEQLERLPEPLGDVLDLATGRGQVALFLWELGSTTSVVGVDWDARKVAVARIAADGDATLRDGDIRSIDLPEADTVLLIDVLHYLPPEEQDALLARAAEAVRPGGRLLVREVDPTRGLKSRVAMLAERIATRTAYNRGATLAFRTPGEIVETLSRLGLDAHVESGRKNPLANAVIVAERRPDATS